MSRRTRGTIKQKQNKTLVLKSFETPEKNTMSVPNNITTYDIPYVHKMYNENI